MSNEIGRVVLVREVMMPVNLIPVVPKNAIFQEALQEMLKHRLGIACIVDAKSKLRGVITDGDIRRILIKVQKPLSALLVDDAINHAELTPSTIAPTDSLEDAIALMEAKKIWDLPIIDEQNTLVGLVHLHPVVKRLLNL